MWGHCINTYQIGMYLTDSVGILFEMAASYNVWSNNSKHSLKTESVLKT